MLNVVLIGRGAIASEVLKHIPSGREVAVTGFIVRPGREVEARAALPATIQVASAIEHLSTMPDLIAECAGHSAVAEFGERALRRGIDFLVISIGALADAGLRARLEAAADAGGAKLILPAGAIAGADALTAARIGGLERVVYTSRKPPATWRGTPAEDDPPPSTQRSAAMAVSKLPATGRSLDAVLQWGSWRRVFPVSVSHPP